MSSKMTQEQTDLILSLLPEARKIARLILKRKDEDFEQVAAAEITETVAIGWTDPVYILRRMRDRLKNEIRNHKRRNRIKVMWDRYGDAKIVDESGEVLEHVCRNEVMDILTDDERRVVEMRVARYKLMEIAVELRMSTETVEVMMKRIKRKIRKYFSG